jgi:hypothetical protein
MVGTTTQAENSPANATAPRIASISFSSPYLLSIYDLIIKEAYFTGITVMLNPCYISINILLHENLKEKNWNC